MCTADSVPLFLFKIYTYKVSILVFSFNLYMSCTLTIVLIIFDLKI